MAAAVVFGRACGTASTTLDNEETNAKTCTSLENELKNRPGADPEPRDSPDELEAPQKVAERTHRRPRRAKGTQKDDTSTPKEATEDPKERQKKSQGPQKNTKRPPKSKPDLSQGPTTRGLWQHLGIGSHNYSQSELPCR